MSGIPPVRHEFPSRDALAQALAASVAEHLQVAVATRGRAMIAVSGGTTPTLFFQTLSKADIAWGNIVITLVDERFVPADSPRSNAGLVARHLLAGPASAAHFLPLYEEKTTAERAAKDASTMLIEEGLPPDVVVLGMGPDGHTASFFPDATNLQTLLDPGSLAVVSPVTAKSADEERLTMTLAALAAAPFIALHIEGEDKRAVLEEVLGGKQLPIGAMLAAAKSPVAIYWAP